MMNFKQSLDRYLTQTPDEYFGIDDSFYEKICDAISEEIWEEHEEWFYSTDFVYCCDKLANKNNSDIGWIAIVIERYIKMYL